MYIGSGFMIRRTCKSQEGHRERTSLLIVLDSCSIVSGTPPSIRIDSSIRAAPTIVDHIRIGGYPQISVFAEVELCLIWDKASFVPTFP